MGVEQCGYPQPMKAMLPFVDLKELVGVGERDVVVVIKFVG